MEGIGNHLYKKVCIAGATGFLGRNLVDFLSTCGFDVIVLNRKDFETDKINDKISDCEVLINVIGESVAGIWTKEKKKKIRNSRIDITERLVELVNKVGRNIRVFINMSAVGIYDNIHIHDEDSLLLANDFLSHVIMDWEGKLKGIENSTIRLIILRLGVVLGRNGGLMKKIGPLFKWGLGFTVKSYDNFPFIHIGDMERAIIWMLDNKTISGKVNVVSPQETSIYNFYRMLAWVYMKRILFRFNPGVIRIILGESSIMLIKGQHVVPQKLIRSGFSFKFADLKAALSDLKDK